MTAMQIAEANPKRFFFTHVNLAEKTWSRAASPPCSWWWWRWTAPAPCQGSHKSPKFCKLLVTLSTIPNTKFLLNYKSKTQFTWSARRDGSSAAQTCCETSQRRPDNHARVPTKNCIGKTISKIKKLKIHLKGNYPKFQQCQHCPQMFPFSVIPSFLWEMKAFSERRC